MNQASSRIVHRETCVVIELNQKNKQIVWDFWQHLEAASADQLVQIANESMVSNITWHGPDPINELRGVTSFISDFWLPLQKSFRDLRRQTHIFLAASRTAASMARMTAICG